MNTRSTMIYRNVREMPPPEARIRIGDNMVYPAMFFYAPEGADLHAIARHYGFDLQISVMEGGENITHLLDRGDVATFMLVWRPAAGRFKEGDGWKLVGAYDTEEGPTAMFVRRLTPVELAIDAACLGKVN